MARRDHGAAAETLGEIESAADRLSDWLQENIRAVLAGVVALLALAGLGSWWISSREGQEQAASAALAEVREDYLSAMGVGPGALEVPELASPEAASQIRREYEERFGAVATSHPGSVAGTLASLESARLAAEDGRAEDARSRLEETLSEASAGDAVRGLVLQRRAQLAEGEGDWARAAEFHEEAGSLGDYPLRGWALADAARCAAQAGDSDAALALYERMERVNPDLRLPQHQATQLRELRAAAGR